MDTPRQRAGPRARTNNTKWKHTSKAQSSQQRQEAPIARRSGRNWAVPNSPKQPNKQH